MGQGLGTGWGGLWDCPCMWATWEGWLFLVILGYFWLFMGLSLHLGNQCEEEGGKHPEKICGGGQENGGTLLLIQKGSLYFPFDQYIQ